MRASSSVPTALRSLAKHKLRTTLSALGVVFGVGALLSVFAVAQGAQRALLEQIERLGTHTIMLRPLDATEGRAELERRIPGLTAEDLPALRAGARGVVALAPIQELNAPVPDLRSEDPPGLLAVTREYFEVKGLRAARGRILTDGDEARSNLVCVLGAGVARDLGTRGRPGSVLALGGAAFEVVGVLEARTRDALGDEVIAFRDHDHAIFLPLAAAAAATAGTLPSTYDEVSVSFDSAKHLRAGPAAIERALDRSRAGVVDYEVIVPTALLAQASRTQRMFNLVLGSVAAICLLLGGIGIMNSLLASVSERTSEIGLRRAVGANRLQVAGQFVTEAIVLSGLGSLLGLLVGAAGARSISVLADWPTVFSPLALLLALGMALGVGLFAGVYPAVRAARVDPLQALRHA